MGVPLRALSHVHVHRMHTCMPQERLEIDTVLSDQPVQSLPCMLKEAQVPTSRVIERMLEVRHNVRWGGTAA